MPPIGFVILINPFSPLSQTERLIRTLNRMFDHPPIVCHHDFGKNPNWLEHVSDNVRICRPHVETGWGTFGCVEATIRSLGILYSGNDAPEWYIYLSGADYPIKSANKILEDLTNSPYDGYIEHRVLTGTDFVYPQDRRNPQGWKWDDWLHHCHKRYCSVRLDVHGINRYLRRSKRTYWLEHPFITKGRIPFGEDFKAYCGEVWYCANHRCAARLIDFFEADRKVANHYRTTLVPEESYPQTVLANTPGLNLSQNILRYIDWTERKSSPKILTKVDFGSMVTSTAHFARKFDVEKSRNLLSQLDEIVFKF